MYNTQFKSKKGNILLVCLLSLLMLVSLALSAGALTTDTLYSEMTPVVTLNLDDTTGRTGTVGDFAWQISGGGSIKDYPDDGYLGKVAGITPGGFSLTDTNGVLAGHSAVAASADFYFVSYPSVERLDGKDTTSSDSSSDNFSPQMILSWIGTGESGTNYLNGICIDSEGYLYCDGKSTPANYQLQLNTWYNLKVLYTDTNKAELWVNGNRIATLPCMYRIESASVNFFNANYSYTAYVKNIAIETADGTYYNNTTKEHSADFISYQTTKASGGSFNLRVLSGINSTVYEKFGYEVIKLTAGNTTPVKLSGEDTKVYSSVYGGNTSYSIKENFGYNYAALATIENLTASETFELIVFPFTISTKGDKIYGEAISLKHAANATDASGYPTFTLLKDTTFTQVDVSDDAFIYSAHGAAENYGSTALLQVRNNGKGVLFGDYRAAYFKFTVPKATVDKLSTMANAYLRLHVFGFEDISSDEKKDRVPAPLTVYGAPTNWTEGALTYNTFYSGGANSSAVGTKIATISADNYDTKSFILFDILSYLKTQTKNADGSLTVAFCVTHEQSVQNARLVYLSAKESGADTAPVLRFEESLYGRSISNVKADNDGDEPLSYSKELVSAWFDGGLRDTIYSKPNKTIENISPNGYNATAATGDFTEELPWAEAFLWTRIDDVSGDNYKISDDQWQKSKFARTLSTLGTSTANAYLNSTYATTSEYDIYGGITNAGFTGTPTGYFHVEEHDGRPYIIDPLGNPYFAISVNAFNYGETANLESYSETKYTNKTNFFNKMTDELQAMGINTTFASDEAAVLAVENGLATTIDADGVSEYMATLDRSQVAEGQFPHNNTINVFDPDFVSFVNAANKAIITAGGYADNKHVFGYTSDNELPSQTNMLESYLLLDPSVPTNTFSYHTAWEWFARKIGKDNPTLKDYYALSNMKEMNSEFMGFVYAMYYKTISESIEAVDANHMYMGSRVAGDCRTDTNYLKVAGHYLDIITTNLYGGLNPDLNTMTNYYRVAGVPFIVTEFYAKSMDAIDANGYMLANSTGAGFVVNTQRDRADYYEHFALTLLESKACVGWSWYRFRDNDQGIWQTKDGQYTNLRMLFVSYGENPYPVTFMAPNGFVISLAEMGYTQYNWKENFEQVYVGETMTSNQNVNKGLFNATYGSTAIQYSYDSTGKLTGSTAYILDDTNFTTAYPQNNPTLPCKDGSSIKLGRVTNSDGSYTVTILAIYKGRYIELTDSISKISKNVMGIVNYFDAN